jgi:hypothetical protein
MGRNTYANTLTDEKYVRLNEVIRAHHYCQLDAMVELLSDENIKISRSALQRHCRKLQRLDGQVCQDENVSVVVIVTRATGATNSILTTASADQILAAISSIPIPHS